MTNARFFATAALTALALTGCGGPSRGDAYLHALAEARRDHHDGRFELAASKYDEAAKTAKLPRDAVYARYEAALARASEVIDAVRRGVVPAVDIAADLGQALTATEQLAGEARALRSSSGGEPIRSALIDELERAGRALEMVQHGCGLLVTARGREHDPEALTAIKRGYLNLVHVREEIARQAAAAAAIPVTIPRFLTRRPAE